MMRFNTRTIAGKALYVLMAVIIASGGFFARPPGPVHAIPSESFYKLPYPTLDPAGYGYGVAFGYDSTDSSTYVAVVNDSSPYVNIYKKGSGDTFAKLDNPIILPTAARAGVAFSPSATYLATVGGSWGGGDYLTVYKRSSDIFTKLTTYTQPTKMAYSAVAFSPDSKYMAVGQANPPGLEVYSITGSDIFTKLATVDSPGSSVYGVAFSHDSAYMAIASTSGFTTTYSITGSDIFTKLSTPVDPPAGDSNGVTFNHDSTLVAFAHTTTPYITVYSHAAGVLTRLVSQPDAPAGAGKGVAFSHDSGYLAVAHETTPYITVYRYNGSAFSKVTDPHSLPTSTGYGVAFSNDSSYLALACPTSNKLWLYKKAVIPTVTAAGTSTDGSKIILTFSKAMADPSGDRHKSFKYQYSGGPDENIEAAVLKADTTKIELTPDWTILAGEVITVSYTYSELNGDVTAADYGVLADFTPIAVTNNVPATYTVTYNGNGNTSGSAPVDQTKTHDVTLTLATNSGSLDKTGYTFSGWNTAADGSGTDYAAGGDYTANAAVTLHAKWTPNTYTVTYNGNGNTSGSAPADQTKTHAVALTLRNNTGSLARTGYNFSGWNTAANGTGTSYAAGANYTTNAAATLYAKWTAAMYTVTFDKQSGTGGSNDVSATYGAAMPAATAPTRVGYAFNGYFTAAGGAGTQYYTAAMASARNWDIAAPTTLYAYWTAATYTVTYNGNGNTSGSAPADQTKTHDVALTLATNSGSLAKTGYTFSGWNTLANGTGTDYAAGAGYTANAAVTLYAKWLVNPLTVSSATTNAPGTVITITFNKAMANPSGKQASFTYKIGGVAAGSFSSAALNADTTKIDLTCSGTAIAYGNTVTISYIAGTVQAADGGSLASFTDQAVTNNMPGPATAVALTAVPSSITADGTSISALTATVTNELGNPVADGTSVVFTTSKGTVGSSTITKTTSNGIARATLTSAAGTQTVVADVSAATNGITKMIAVFFIPPSAPPVTDNTTTTVTGSDNITNTATGGIVTVNATTGSLHTITTAKYGGNPGGAPSFNSSGNYYDVHIDNTAGLNSITIQFSPATASTIIYFWTGTAWSAVSNQAYAGGIVTVTVTATTFPNLTDLSGLFVGSGTPVAPTPPSPPPPPPPPPPPTPLNPSIATGAPTSHGSSVAAPATPAPPVSLPNIQIQSASLSAGKVAPGTPVTVTADITNRSTVNGIKKVTLYVNGQVESTQGITVNSGGSSQLTFNVARSEPGDYMVYVDGVPAGSFTVELFRESDIVLIFGVTMLAMAFVVGMIMLRRRQQGYY